MGLLKSIKTVSVTIQNCQIINQSCLHEDLCKYLTRRECQKPQDCIEALPLARLSSAATQAILLCNILCAGVFLTSKDLHFKIILSVYKLFKEKTQLYLVSQQKQINVLLQVEDCVQR